MAGRLENTVSYGVLLQLQSLQTKYCIPILITNGHRLKHMFGGSRWDGDYSPASPPEPPNIATFGVILMFTKYMFIVCLGLPHKNR